MSANLLYSLSDDNPKHTGCINGILQHFLSSRAINGHHHHHHHKRLPPGQSKMEFKDTKQETKEKSVKDHKGTPRMSAESSMVSSSSSTSSTLSSVQYQSHQLSIRNSRKQQIINNAMKHIDSPRPQKPSNLQNQRISINTSRSEHLSSSKDKKIEGHTRRLSYDGRESREIIKSSLKLNELPRLSLDSRQGKTRSTQDLNSELFQLEEPGSNRPISSILTKLMGLEDIPQSTPSNKGQQRRSSRSEDLDLLSRSTRSTDESDTDSERHSISIYREIDKRLADLDFRKAGKDLRALKHILEAMQRTKSKMEAGCKGNQASESMSNMCMINGGCSNGIRNSQDPDLAKWRGKRNGSSKAVDKGTTKPGKVLRSPDKPAPFAFQQQTPSNLPRVRTGQSANTKSDAIEKRRAKDPSPRTQHKFGKLEKFSQERRARSTTVTSTQEPKSLTRKAIQNSSKNIEARSKKAVQRKLELDDQYDIVHTPRPSQKLYRTVGHGVNVIEESTTALKEQPSPVSVLDAEFYGDESPSPVKKKATAFRDDYTTPVSTQTDWIAVDTNHLSSGTKSCFSSDNGYNMYKVKETPDNLWLPKELSTERCQLQANRSYPNIEAENDFLRSIFAKDLARRTDSWTDFTFENSWLVLDIERLVFKDLIVELVHDEVSR